MLPQDDEEAEKENENLFGDLSGEEGEDFRGASDDDDEEAMVSILY